MTRNEFRAQAIALPRDSVDSVLATNKVIRNTYLLLSMTLVPVLAALILKPKEEKDTFVVRWAKKAYLPLLDWALERKKLVIGSALALEIVRVWMHTEHLAGEEKYRRRVAKVVAINDQHLTPLA